MTQFGLAARDCEIWVEVHRVAVASVISPTVVIRVKLWATGARCIRENVQVPRSEIGNSEGLVELVLDEIVVAVRHSGVVKILVPVCRDKLLAGRRRVHRALTTRPAVARRLAVGLNTDRVLPLHLAVARSKSWAE